jgi:HPr kinase/phosphorylase
VSIDRARNEVSIRELASHLVPEYQFSVVAGGEAGLERIVGLPDVQRVGIALTGHVDHTVPNRIQLLGRAEMKYLATLAPEERHTLLRTLCEAGIPAMVVTAGEKITPELIEVADEFAVALLSTESESTIATEQLHKVLLAWLSCREVRHAALVDVHGVGVLLLGKSGIGKSEIALELVSRGHRLVADDVVILDRTGSTAVVGHSPELTRNHMEIRGLGIINIKDLYGVAAVRERKRVEFAVELVEWDEMSQIDRLGLDLQRIELAEVKVPFISLPVRPGRSLSLIIEVAARNRLLQVQGTHSARTFAQRLGDHIAQADDHLTEPPSNSVEEIDE